MYVCVFVLYPKHNRQTDIESDRGCDPSQQDAQTVAPGFSCLLVKVCVYMCSCMCVYACVFVLSIKVRMFFPLLVLLC